jgi:hypothetical protein
MVLLLWGVLSDDRTRLYFVRVIVCSSKSFVIMYRIFIFYMLNMLINIYIKYIQGLCQSRISTADYALFLVASATRAAYLFLTAWDPRYIASGWTHRKHRFLYCCVLIQRCRNVFTPQLRSNKLGADSQRTPLASPFLLLHDITAYVTRSLAACVRVNT